MNRSEQMYGRATDATIEEVSVRTHGWGGSPPCDEQEARDRILDATRAAIADGRPTATSDIARSLGVTRQTVYRYYPSTEALLDAAAVDAVSRLTTDLVRHTRRHVAATGGDAGDAAVEVVAYVYENLRDDPALNRLLSPGRIGTMLAGLTAPSAISLGSSLLDEIPVDWRELDLDASGQRDLVEHLLRVLQSLVLDPGDPERTGEGLRAYLQRWVAPALRVRSAR